MMSHNDCCGTKVVIKIEQTNGTKHEESVFIVGPRDQGLKDLENWVVDAYTLFLEGNRT